MKTLVRRLEALEGYGNRELEALSDEEVDERCIAFLERVEAMGVAMPAHWRDLDLMTALERVGAGIEALL